MNTHPYLRAYMAGIALPTVFMLLAFIVFCVTRYGYAVDMPIERVIIFPLVLVPNLWGVWNIFYVMLRPLRKWPIGIHGAMLPVVMLPAGYMVTRALNAWVFDFVGGTVWLLVPWLLVVYYLLWKYAVSALNRMLGIA
jgi:hypothetical protein